MSFELQGKLIVIEPVIEVSQSFRKREFVIEVANEKNPEWNDFIKFQVTQDRCQLLDNLNIGEDIKVDFNIKGRKWEKDGKVSYFSNLEAWRIARYQDNSSVEHSSDIPVNDAPPPDIEDDLPF